MFRRSSFLGTVLIVNVHICGLSLGKFINRPRRIYAYKLSTSSLLKSIAFPYNIIKNSLKMQTNRLSEFDYAISFFVIVSRLLTISVCIAQNRHSTCDDIYWYNNMRDNASSIQKIEFICRKERIRWRYRSTKLWSYI